MGVIGLLIVKGGKVKTRLKGISSQSPITSVQKTTKNKKKKQKQKKQTKNKKTKKNFWSFFLIFPNWVVYNFIPFNYLSHVFFDLVY